MRTFNGFCAVCNLRRTERATTIGGAIRKATVNCDGITGRVYNGEPIVTVCFKGDIEALRRQVRKERRVA